MNDTDRRWMLPAALAALGLAALLLFSGRDDNSCPDGPCPVPKPAPVKPDEPKPKPKPRRPWGGDGSASVEAKVGGPVMDGVEIHCDLPGPLHRRNTASKGLGNCVFTSIHHSALWQNTPQLKEFAKWLTDKGIPGGGYPQKVDQLIPQISKDRGLPEPDYLNIPECSNELLIAACKGGRMPAVTYGKSPTGRYGGSSIAHMVTLVHADEKYFVVLDNNYPGYDQFEWMSPADFTRICNGGKACWAVILLDPPPAPPPSNRRK